MENSNTQVLIEKIKAILTNSLPLQTWVNVWEYRGFGGNNQIGIAFACSDENINRVAGQKPQIVSLLLDADTYELNTQIFGGNGGGRITRKPDLNNPKEKFYAMVGIKIPFRTPDRNETAVLKAIERFAQRWLQAIRDNKNVLTQQEMVNYELF